jgi:thiamine biosynthesis lipoprotein
MKKAITLLLALATILTLSACNNDDKDIIFDLILGEEYSVDVNSYWVDPGFIAKDDTVDISSYVVVSGEVNTAVAGDYIITYSLVYNDDVITKTRTVIVGSFNSQCSDIEDTTLMRCDIVWSSYLNTVVKLSLYVKQDTELNTDDVFAEVEQTLAYYTIMSDKYKSYDGMMNVHEINNNAGSTVTIDERLFNLIEFTFDHQDDVNYLFNAALGPVLQVWHDYRENCTENGVCVVPSENVLNNANQYTDHTKVVLDSENRTLTMEENMSLDFGGVSKGYVSKEITAYLDSLDIFGYLLNNGESNISIGGTHPIRENGKFIIAVTDPTFVLPYYATVYLTDGEQLVTSGDYQKYYTVEGTDYHHIIHPDTLMPENYSRSVSIITTDPALADLYSTAIFNMSIEDGQTFVDGIDGLEAIWYGTDGTIHFSENFESQYLIDTFE